MHLHASAPPLAPVRPLLKWAGGKRQLLHALRLHYARGFTRYIEAFVGSGAVFFDLFSAGDLKGRRVRLTDVNVDLIGTYRVVRDRTEDVVAALEELQRQHRTGGDACYYDVRDRRFNPLRLAVMAGGGTSAITSYPPELAAMLIYLNRTGFNGLFRLNRGGRFNVPAGRYNEPRICDAGHVRAVARAFRTSRVALHLSPFEATLGNAGVGDFVYCDPPYAPLSRTSSFASYTADGFTPGDQERLQHAILEACRRGASVVLSNSSAPEILSAYTSPAARRAGLTVYHVPARRAINSRASARGPVDELIITNVKPRELDAVRPRMLRAEPRRRRLSA